MENEKKAEYSMQEILNHYKEFFGLHLKGINLTEEDQMIFDWVQLFIKDNFQQPSVRYNEDGGGGG